MGSIKIKKMNTYIHILKRIPMQIIGISRHPYLSLLVNGAVDVLNKLQFFQQPERCMHRRQEASLTLSPRIKLLVSMQ
jgi:hypothetical protein